MTTNTYNQLGELTAIDYSDGTVSVAYTNGVTDLDRQGQPRMVKDASGVWRMEYDYAGRLTALVRTNGTFNGITVSNRYNRVFGRDRVLAKGRSWSIDSTYGFDAYGRLSTVTRGGESASYGYLANSDLLPQTTNISGGPVLITTRTWDYGSRLRSIASSTNSAAVVSYAYLYDGLGRRTQSTLADGSWWSYGYDDRDEVTSGKRYWPDFSAVAGQQFEYGFDNIGNRASTLAGGDQDGSGLRLATYTPNSLNQYTQRTVPGAVDVLGNASAGASVTGNDLSPYRHGEYFQKALAINNASAPQYQGVTVVSTLGAARMATTGSVFVAKTPEVFTCDLDGNLVSDGRWTNRWDAENRLVSMESLSDAPAGSKRRLTFDYDAQGRRILKTGCVWANEAWSFVLSNKFLYDGWNLVAELNATSNALIRSYLWGLDLSGSPQGAGGVGGLLAVTPSGAMAKFPAYDGNGNVMGLLHSTTANWVARYEYGPFGELIRATGPMAKANPFRFSTKYQAEETDLLYYGYRYYDAHVGRWLSRDPVAEKGGEDLYGFVRQDGINATDLLGLTIECKCADAYFRQNGIGSAMYTKSGNIYSLRGGYSGPSGGAGRILARMLLTSHKLTAKDLSVEQLRRHVAARLTIVNNALKANFKFGTGEKQDWTDFVPGKAQSHFDRLNNGQTVIACTALTRMIFETGNNFGSDSGLGWAEGHRGYDGVWIPGDWGYIENRAYVRGIWSSGLEGENVIHTGVNGGQEMFWGHFSEGVHPSVPENVWFSFVRTWTGGGKLGNPVWNNDIKYPTTGLQK